MGYQLDNYQCKKLCYYHLFPTIKVGVTDSGKHTSLKHWQYIYQGRYALITTIVVINALAYYAGVLITIVNFPLYMPHANG
jgi:hypothetical protein